MRAFGIALVGIAGFGAACLSACGGGGGPDIDTDAENVCSEIAEVACFNMYQCCSEGEIESRLNVDQPRTQDECTTDLTRLCERQLATLSWSVSEGRAKFEGSTMNACLEAFVAPSDTCADIYTKVPWIDACKDLAWVGTQLPDEECFFNYECEGGNDGNAFCSPARICVQRPVAGQECGPGCASDFFCDGLTGLCADRRDVGGMCTTEQECIEDLYCDETTGMCAALLPIDAPCTSNAVCESGSCTPGTCMGSSQSCYDVEDCSGQCADDQSFCTQDYQCQIGTCSTGGSCYMAGACDAGGGPGTCTLPVQCVRACVGDITCADPHVLVDFCEAVDSLPGID